MTWDDVLWWSMYWPYALILGGGCFTVARWCLERRRKWMRFLVLLALAVFGAQTVYAVLRLTGTVILPTDSELISTLFEFGSSWGNDGARRLILYGSFFAGTAIALAADRRNRRRSGSNSIEEKM